MAIIHTTLRNANTEAVLKILEELTLEISLKHGRILMTSIPQYYPNVLKLSLYLVDDVLPIVGLRNVFMEDVADTLQIRYGNRVETTKGLTALMQSQDWESSFPSTHCLTYQSDQLIEAAKDIRNYLLIGKLPNAQASPAMLRFLSKILPEKGLVEFDVLPTLTDYPDFN